MIKLRLSSFSDRFSYDVEIVEGESIKEAVDRVVLPIKIKRELSEVFQVLKNGERVDPALWGITELSKEDMVLIAPLFKSGDAGSILKQFVLIAVVITVGILTQGAALAGTITPLQAGLITASASIGASLVLNALIPPPALDQSSGFGASPLSGSQTYSLSGQSNQIKRNAMVPKVYGTHRIFPAVAANPYVELEQDAVTGEIVQYLYCIYDFGFGPNLVTDLKIGDSPITNFTDVTYNFVDLNRPTADEGFWDTKLLSQFTLYKGDVNIDPASVVLDGNQENPQDPVSSYYVIRNSALNILNVDQEIIVNLVFPRGLHSYSSTGDLGTASVDIRVTFSEIDSPWEDIPFNDLSYVSKFSTTKVDPVYERKQIPFIVPSLNPTTDPNYVLEPSNYAGVRTSGPIPNYIYEEGSITSGVPKGATSVVLTPGAVDASPGNRLIINGIFAGIVTSVTFYDGLSKRYNLDRPIDRYQPLFTWKFLRQITEPGSGAITYTKTNTYIPQAYREIINPGVVRFTENSAGSAVYPIVRFSPKSKKQIIVKVTRLKTVSQYSTRVVSELNFLGLYTRFNSPAIITDKRHTFLEIKIKATNQLNGTISNLSGVCTSVLDTWNGTTWVKQLSGNPAWIFVDLLTGQINKRAIDKSRLHTASILEWANFCDAIPTPPPGTFFGFRRFVCSFILDYSATLQQVLNQVSNSAQASLNLYDGKYGVLIDKLRTVPVQVFTPRNSNGFSSSRQYSATPHGVNIKYIDPKVDWETRELTVYDDGYTILNAEKIDDLLGFGITNPEQAWRFGRYMLAQNRLRQETISIQVDFENLVCTRGDYVKITQDAMKVGGTPCRVKSISTNRIVVDDGIDTNPLLNYGYTYRAKTGEIRTNTLTVVNSDTFDLNGTPLPQAGDLIIIGEVGLITYDCIVKSIIPESNLSATLTLVEKADAVYSAESLDVFPPYDPQLSKTVNPDFAPPSEVENLSIAENTWECTGSGYSYYINLDWDEPIGAAYETFEIYVDSGRGYNLHTFTRESFYKYIVPLTELGKEHNFKVLAVSSTGKKLDLGSVSQVAGTPLSKTSRPSNVEFLNIDITGEVLQLFWYQVPDCDCREYLIRYSPLTTGTWEASIPLLRVDRNTTLASTQARTGTYLIKAVDFNGNESELAAVAITTIPNLFGLNIITTMTDFPALDGNKDRVEKDGDTLMLANTVVGGVETQEYYDEGYYYYKTLLNVGEIYTVRLQSLIQAEGFTLEDMMSNWITLEDVLFMSNSKYSEWDVETQYRATDNFNVMSEWLNLSLVDPISEGQVDSWSPWRKFTIGDATGRVFQFRLKLLSNKTSVTPRVFDGTIKVDVPDRIESYTNLTALIGGYSLTYSPAFMGPGTSPNIQVSIDNAQSGDYWAISGKTLSGFTIEFFDKLDNPVSRQFDVQVKGYGRKALNVI